MAENTIEIANEDELPPNNIVVAEENELPPVKKKELTKRTTTSSSGVYGQYEDILAKNKKVKADLGITDAELNKQIKSEELGKQIRTGLSKFRERQVGEDFNLNQPKPSEIKINKFQDVLSDVNIQSANIQKDLIIKEKQLDEVKNKIEDSITTDEEKQKLLDQHNLLVEDYKNNINQLTELDKKHNVLEKGINAIDAISDKEINNPIEDVVRGVGNLGIIAYNNSIPTIVRGADYLFADILDLNANPLAKTANVDDYMSQWADYFRSGGDKLSEDLKIKVDEDYSNANIFEKDANGNYSNLSNPKAYVNFAGQMIGNITTTAAAGLTGGAGAAYLTGVAQTMPEVYNEAKKVYGDTYDGRKKSALLGLGISMIAGAFEESGVMPMVDDITKKTLIKEATKEIIEKSANQNLSPEILQKLFTESYANSVQKLSGTVTKIGKSSLNESVSEIKESVSSDLAKITADVFRDTDEKKFGTTYKDLAVNAIENGVGGFVSAAPLSVFANTDVQQKDEISKLANISANDINHYKDVLQGIAELQQSGKISEKTANEYAKKYTQLVEADKKIPVQIQGSIRTDANELVQEKEMLKQEIEGKDEALIEPQKERINQINEELKQIANPQAKIEGTNINTIANENQNRSIQENANEKNVGKRDGQNEKGGQGESETSSVLQNEKGRKSLLSESDKVAEPVSPVSSPTKGSGGVDDKGVPINEGIWYHGSPTEGISGKDLKPNEKGLLFFTRDKNIAERYATNDYDGNTSSNNVFERNLEVNNIFDPEKNSDNAEIIDLLASKGNFENAGRNADFDALAKEALENGEWSVLETKEFIDGLKKLGYDAIYIDNRPYYSENAQGKRTFSRDIAVFDTKQHKEQPLKETASSVTESEQLKQDLDKEIEIAKQKLRKAASGSLSSGGLQAIPEFVNLVKLYYKKGQYKVDEFISIAKTFFGDKFTEKQIKDAHDKIISEEIKTNEDLRNKVEKEKGKVETIKTESNKKITELKNKIKTEKSDIKAAKKIVKEYIDTNKQDLKGLSENQLINLAKKATNATNVKQLNDLVDYIDNVSKDGNYANAYDSAKKSFKDLKKLAKNKKSLANLSNAIKAITEVSPTSKWDINKIKEYNRIAELISESVKVAGVDNNGNLKNADMNISEQEILDYADKLQSEYRNDMETNLREQFGNLGINADDLSLRELQQILKDLNNTTNIDAQQAELSKLADKANLVRLLNDLVDSKINDLKGIDTSKLSESELNYYKKIIDIDTSKLDSADLALLNNVLDNIAYNEDFSGAGTFINQEKLQKSINEINKQMQTNPMIGAISSETFLSKLGKGVSNMNLAFYRLSLANTYFQTKLKEITGYSELSESYRKVRAFNDKVNAIFKDIGDSVTDRFKMGAIGHITQRSGTSTSEMNKSQAEALKELIRSKTLLLQEGNSEKLIELGKQQEKALIELGILDADGKEIEGLDINKVINDFKNNSPKLFEMVEKSKGAFSEIEDKVFENSKIFKNEIPNKVEGYLPIRSKAINSKKAKLEDGKEFAKGQAVDKSVTKSIIKRVGLGKDRYLDLDFPSVMSSKANEIANTAYTLPNRMFVDQVFKSKEMEKALGGKENADALHKYFMDKVDHQLNKYPQSENIDRAIKELNSLYKQGAGRVLGGVAQGVKQSLVLINTTTQLGKDAPFLFNAWKDMATGRTEDFMDQFPIAMRIDTGFGTAESASQLIEKMSPKERSKFLKSLETIAKALKITNKMAGDLFMKGLMAGDGFAAKSSFIAYYLKDLKRQNVDLSLLDSDPDLFWEEQTKNPNMYAARWADTKVVNDQNINDPSDVAEFFSGDSQTKLLFKNTFLGLSSYSTNFRSKVSNDVYALYKKGFSDKETNKQVAKNIIGGVSESIALNSLKRALKVALTAGAVAAIKQYGFEEPRKEEEKKVLSQKGKEQILFNTANDMLFSGTSTIGENFGKSLLNYYSDKLHGIDELEKQRDNLFLAGKKEEALRVQDKIKEMQFDRPFYASSQEGFLQNFGLAGKRAQLFYNTFESGKEFAAPKQKFIEGDFTSSDLYPMETKGAIRSKSERNFLGTIFAADALISTMPLDADVVNMYDKFRRAGLKQLEFKYKGKEGILGSGYYSRLSKIQSKIDAIENIPKNKGKIEELELQKEKIIQEKYKD